MDSRKPVYVILKRQLVFLFVALLAMVVTGVIPEGLQLPVLLPVVSGITAGVLVFLCVLIVTRSDTVVGAALRKDIQKTSVVVASFSLPAIFAISVAAGICEELLFRGFIQGWLSGNFHYAVGIGAGAIVFGWMHPGSKATFIFTSLYGLLFGMAYHWTESVIFIIVWHATYDFVALLFLVKAPGFFQGHRPCTKA